MFNTDKPVYEVIDDEESQLEEDEEVEHGKVLYRASFKENEAAYVKYTTLTFVFLCLTVGLAMYGLGIFFLLYIPIWRYRARKDMQRRRLYITSESIVYKTNIPALCPCCGDNKKEQHVLLPLVTDVTVQQGFVEAWFGLFSLKIENAGQGSPGSGADVSIQGLSDPKLLKRIILCAASAKRAGQTFSSDDIEQWSQGNKLPAGTGGDLMNMPFSSQPANLQMEAVHNTLLRIEQLLAAQQQQQNGGFYAVATPPAHLCDEEGVEVVAGEGKPPQNLHDTTSSTTTEQMSDPLPSIPQPPFREG